MCILFFVECAYVRACVRDLQYTCERDRVCVSCVCVCGMPLPVVVAHNALAAATCAYRLLSLSLGVARCPRFPPANSTSFSLKVGFPPPGGANQSRQIVLLISTLIMKATPYLDIVLLQRCYLPLTTPRVWHARTSIHVLMRGSVRALNRDKSVSQTSFHKEVILGRHSVFRVFLL